MTTSWQTCCVVFESSWISFSVQRSVDNSRMFWPPPILSLAQQGSWSELNNEYESVCGAGCPEDHYHNGWNTSDNIEHRGQYKSECCSPTLWKQNKCGQVWICHYCFFKDSIVPCSLHNCWLKVGECVSCWSHAAHRLVKVGKIFPFSSSWWPGLGLSPDFCQTSQFPDSNNIKHKLS